MWHHYMTSFRRVFELLVVAFATNTTPSLALKPLDDLFTGHKLFIHTNTHHVKVKEKWGNSPLPIYQQEERIEVPARKLDRAENPPAQFPHRSKSGQLYN
jgi:hypothetical protein